MGSCLGSCVSSSTESSSSSSSCSATQPTCAAAAASNSWLLWRRPLRCGATDEQDAELLSNANERCRRRGLVYRILKFKRQRQSNQFKYWDQQQQPSYAKLQSDGSAFADIQLQNLDVYKLLNTATPSKETELQSYTRIANSRASSSLDLEWEHEYSQLRQYQQQQQQQPQQQQQQQQQQQRHTPPMVATQPRYASLDQLTTTTAATHGRHATRQPRAVLRHGSFTRTSCCSSTQNSWSHISTPESLEWDIDAEQEQQRQLRLEDDNLDDETLKLLHQIEQLKNHVLQETGDGLSTGVGAAVAEDLSEGLQFRAMHFGANSATELELHIS